MTLTGTVHRMPYERRGVPTETPEARAEITAAITALKAAQAHVKDLTDARNDALRRHYAAGVDPRDLTKIAHDAGWTTANIVYIKRKVAGARPDS